MKLKKIFAGVLAGAMILSLAACGGNNAKPGNTSGGGDKSGNTSGGGDAGKELTLSIGYTTASNDDDPYHLTALRFKEIVEEKTGGRITVNEYPSSQLGSEPEMWEGMQTGTCDMAVMTNAYVSSYVPANGTLDLPFIFSDLEQARSVVDGEFGKSLIDNMAGTGVTCLAFSEGGFRQLCTRSAAIRTPGDLSGLKIRCMETKTYLSAYASLGVNATPMAWGELLTALQQGTVDGCDAPLSVLYTNGFPDICQYIDNVNLFYSPLPICISTNLFESLSAEDQQLLLDAAVQAAKAARDNNDATAERMESDLTEQGMTIIAEDEVDNAAFRDAVQSCYEEMESYVGSDWLAKIKSEVGLS